MRLDVMPRIRLGQRAGSVPGTDAVLLGSGISRPAKIPTGWEVTHELCPPLAGLEGQDAPAAEPLYSGNATAFKRRASLMLKPASGAIRPSQYLKVTTGILYTRWRDYALVTHFHR